MDKGLKKFVDTVFPLAAEVIDLGRKLLSEILFSK